MMIWKSVAEHQTVHLQDSNSDPGILELDCAHVALVAPVQDLDASAVTNAVMLLTSSSKRFRLRAPGFQVARDRFVSRDPVELISRLRGVSFLLQPSSAKH
jgi:hypothetical protein